MTNYEIPSVIFDSQALLDRAVQETDLNDFGDDSFREPFNVLLKSLDTEAQLNPVGRYVQYERILNTLKNRLRQSEWVRRNPEILDETIEQPVVIIGLPRTGTTMLHRVLCSDQRFYAPLWYEVRNPAPFMDWVPDAEDQRLVLAKAEVAALLEANPEIAAIHPMDPLGADEDILLLEHSFYSTVPAAFCNTPSYTNWLFSHDNQAGYDYLKLQLQSLQWQKKQQHNIAGSTTNNKRWILKTPHHLHFMQTLLNTFPDAKIISTHRDPVQTIPSISSFNYNLWVTQADNVDAHLVGEQWSEIFAKGMQHTMSVRDQHSEQIIDISFRDLLQDPNKTTQDIYQFINMTLTDQAQSAMQQHREENQRDSRPPHGYSLEQYGFTVQGIESQFSAYRSTFSDLM